MSIVDKFKKILFDDVDDGSEELPERTSRAKNTAQKQENVGFIDYHNEEEENPIREIKVPKEEKIEEPEPEKKTFNFADDSEFEMPTRENRSHSFDAFDIDLFDNEADEVKIVKKDSFNVFESEEKKEREIKDYRKMLSTEESTEKEKKPFTNTPVISPVWGILDKNYKPEEIVDRTEVVTKVNTGATPRSYGPVSYNDQPIIPRKNLGKEPTKQDDLIELNTTITDLINDKDEEAEEEMPKTVSKVQREEDREDLPTPSLTPEELVEDAVIQTENYDEYEESSENYATSSIEEEEIANNNIEDAFESTSEFNSITERDTKEEKSALEDEEDELVDLETLVNKKHDDDDDDAGLDKTIETDLFNLIDSMYKDDEEE